jgi:uncharacterized membrane protein YcaP (DUF421 family)
MNWERMLLGAVEALPRTIVVGVLAYAALVLLLRASGKRTLSKFGAYDLVVTVAVGSTLATTLVTSDVALAQGLTAFVVLLGLQFVISWLMARSPRLRGIVRGEPALLLYRGRFLDRAMRAERVTEAEVRAAARAEGIATLSEIEAAVLETDGSVTIVRVGTPADRSALEGVRDYPTDA